MTICIANLNQSIGDWEGNVTRIQAAIEKAKNWPDPILVLPELAVFGSEPNDLILREDTILAADKALQTIVLSTFGITVICGTMVKINDKLYNVAAIMRDQRILAWVPKRYADLTRRDDARWFEAWGPATGVTHAGAPVGPWSNGRIDVALGKLNAQVPPQAGITRCWLNTHPFAVGEHVKRREMLLNYSRQYNITVAYANALGCPDGTHVYDGNGIIVRNGLIIAESPRFVLNDAITFTTESDIYPSMAYPSLVAYQNTSSYPRSEADVNHVEVELALVLAHHDYFKRAHINKICLALSGGRDSAMCAVLIHRMVTLENPTKSPEEIREIMKNHLICAYLPSNASSSQQTQKAALAIADSIGATCYVIPIADMAASTRSTIEQATGRALSWETDDLTLQNLQARTRSTVIWTLANANDALLLTTSNLSEVAVGYATMDGDTSGGLAPIADLPKTYVSAWLEWARNFHALTCLDEVFAQPPSAELRPIEANQSDEADLMPYPVLDEFVRDYLVQRLSAANTLQKANRLVNDYYAGDESKLRRDFDKFVKMCKRAQWKRVRFANAFKVMSYDLDPCSDLRWPVLQG